MKTRFTTFKENEKENWRYRFTWRGLDNHLAYSGINVLDFIKETGLQEKFRGIKNASNFYAVTTKLADKYITWVKKKEPGHTELELESLWRFFTGGMGEFFYTYLFEYVKKIICVDENDDKIIYSYDFNYVAPLLKGEKDFGVDLTGVVSDREGDRNCVIQVKFWNPFTKDREKIMTNQIAYAAYGYGVSNNLIDSNEDKNVILCWLGDESEEVSAYLKENKSLYKHIIFIGRKSLGYTINERNQIFWNNIVDKLAELANN